MAPYATAAESAHPRADLGSPLVNEPVKPHAGLDVKLTPNAANAGDLTLKPDFSQVDSDTAQISANERFALFFPEKRAPSFWREQSVLDPIQALYTRTITRASDRPVRVDGPRSVVASVQRRGEQRDVQLFGCRRV